MELYHGTNDKKSYKSILKNGFNEGTYFTQYLGTAISYGGKYVFTVDIDVVLRPGQWQYVCSTNILHDKIMYVQKFSLKLKYVNNKLIIDLEKRRRKSEGKEICTNCDGHGEHRKAKYIYRYLKKPSGGAWRTRKDKIIICEVCNGHGFINE